MTLKIELETLLLSQLRLFSLAGLPDYPTIADVEAAFPEVAKLNLLLTRVKDTTESRQKAHVLLAALDELIGEPEEITRGKFFDLTPALKGRRRIPRPRAKNIQGI